MYSNMKYYENICNCLRVIQQDINRKLKSANCWQRTSLNTTKQAFGAFQAVRHGMVENYLDKTDAHSVQMRMLSEVCYSI